MMKIAKGDILLVEVKGPIPDKQLRAFRRQFHEKLEAAGHSEEDIVTIIVPQGSVEITRLTVERMDLMEKRLEDLALEVHRLRKKERGDAAP